SPRPSSALFPCAIGFLFSPVDNDLCGLHPDGALRPAKEDRSRPCGLQARGACPPPGALNAHRWRKVAPHHRAGIRASAAATMAATPVVTAGSGEMRKNGEWCDGASAIWSAGVPPTA